VMSVAGNTISTIFSAENAEVRRTVGVYTTRLEVRKMWHSTYFINITLLFLCDVTSCWDKLSMWTADATVTNKPAVFNVFFNMPRLRTTKTEGRYCLGAILHIPWYRDFNVKVTAIELVRRVGLPHNHGLELKPKARLNVVAPR
jgi:hypothetical protein